MIGNIRLTCLLSAFVYLILMIVLIIYSDGTTINNIEISNIQVTGDVLNRLIIQNNCLNNTINPQITNTTLPTQPLYCNMEYDCGQGNNVIFIILNIFLWANLWANFKLSTISEFLSVNKALVFVLVEQFTLYYIIMQIQNATLSILNEHRQYCKMSFISKYSFMLILIWFGLYILINLISYYTDNNFNNIINAQNPVNNIAIPHNGHTLKHNDTFEKCSICLSDYNNGQELFLLECNHIFHKECINEWLGRNNGIRMNKCPICAV